MNNTELRKQKYKCRKSFQYLIKYLVAAIFLLQITFSNSAFGQSTNDWDAILTGKWMYDLNPSPFVSLYKMSYFLDDTGNKKTVSSILKEARINIDSMPYAQIEFNNNIYLATKKKVKDNIRLFKVLKETDDFFILCSEEDSICECKANTFIYYKPKLKLQRIQRPFSFSLKRNLIKRLNDLELSYPEDYEEMSFCQLLENI